MVWLVGRVFNVAVLGSGSTPEKRGRGVTESEAGCGRAAARKRARQRRREKPSQQHTRIAIPERREHMVCPNWFWEFQDLANLTRSFTAAFVRPERNKCNLDPAGLAVDDRNCSRR